MDDLLGVARRAAQEASALVRNYYGNATVSQKADTSLVTEADTDAHDLIMKRLGVTGIPILSEEDVEHIKTPYPDRLWIIDPLDGTNGFIQGTDDFAVMIGLIEHGKPVLGVVHLPVGDTVYYAQHGNGAYRTESDGTTTKLSVGTRTVPHLRAIQSINHAQPYMLEVADMLGVRERVGIGGIGVKAGIIADDRADYFLTLGRLGEWDVCAPEIILKEAGGVVTDRYGDALCYGNSDSRVRHGAIFSNGACHEDVLHALTRISTLPK